MKKILFILLLLFIGNQILGNIENKKQKEIDKALYCIKYGDKIIQTRYVNGNCYIGNSIANDRINLYYGKEIYGVQK